MATRSCRCWRCWRSLAVDLACFAVIGLPVALLTLSFWR